MENAKKVMKVVVIIVAVILACIIVSMTLAACDNAQANSGTTFAVTEDQSATPAAVDDQSVAVATPAATDGQSESAATSGAADNQSANGNTEENMAGNKPKVEITMQSGGKIVLELDESAAPKSVANFLKLVNAGFYDGLTFHRIIPGFMIQGGDPDGTGMGGSDEEIYGEFKDNGWENPISHVRGVISMARSQNMDSASSQFFITNDDATFLDGQYAAFGHVTEGMDVVDEISAVSTGANDYPTSPVVIEAIKEIK